MRVVELAIFVGLSLHLVRIDLAEHRLPNRFTGSLALLLAVCAVLENNLAAQMSAALWALGTLLILHLLDRNSLGLGDVKYAWSCGAILADGLLALTALWLAFAFAALTCVAKYRKADSQHIAFGPYLFVAVCVVLARHSLGALVEIASSVKQ